MGEHFDLQSRADPQRLVGTLEGQPAQRIAECVVAILAPARPRLDQQCPLMTGLPGAFARPEMRQLPRQRDRRRIAVMGVVQHLVAGALERNGAKRGCGHQVDTVLWLTSSTWAK